MGARLESMADKLRSFQQTVVSAVFLNEAPIVSLIEKNQELLQQVFKLRFEIEEYLAGNKPVTVVVAGGFSSGKSTFLNGLLGIELLIMEDAPASKMVVSIQYGPRESYYLVSGSASAGGIHQRQEISRDELRDFQLGKCQDDLPPDTELEIYLDNELLHSMTLIDTPGLKAVEGTGGDTEGTMRAVTKKSDMLFWLLDARKGTIPEGDKAKLNGFATSAGHTVIILNMMDELFSGAKDSKSNERQRVREEVTKELDKIFPKKDYTLLDYSARLIFEHQPVEVKRKNAINILAKGFADALLDSRFSTSVPGAGNTLIVSALEGPLVKELSIGDAKINIIKTDQELINSKAKLIELLNNIIKNRNNLMLRFDLGTSRIKQDIEDLNSALKTEIVALDKKIKAKKLEVLTAFEKGASHFKIQFSKNYNKLLDDLYTKYIGSNIQKKVIREGSFWRSFAGEVKLMTKFTNHKAIKRERLGKIIKEANTFTEEFGCYGLTEEIIERFSAALMKLTDALSEEACKDLVEIIRHVEDSEYSENDSAIVINTDETYYKFIPNLISNILRILLENKILSSFCEETFIKESRRSIEQFFRNLDEGLNRSN